jgi:hypothetical protein
MSDSDDKCDLLMSSGLIHQLLSNLHHALAAEFAGLFKVLYDAGRLSIDAVRTFWSLALRQDTSTIGPFLKGFEMLFSFAPDEKEAEIWHIVAATEAFPPQVCLFLRRIAARGTSSQRIALYNSLRKFALKVQDVVEKAVATETLVQLIPTDTELSDGLFMECLSQTTDEADLPFLLTLMKASCKCLDQEAAIGCFLALVKKMVELPETAIRLCVTVLLTLSQKMKCHLDDKGFGELANMTKTLLVRNPQEMFQLYQSVLRDNFQVLREEMLTTFLKELCESSRSEAGYCKFVLLIFQRINEQTIRVGFKGLVDASNLLEINELWKLAFASLPDEQILGYLCSLYSNASLPSNRNDYLAKCLENLENDGVLRCITTMIDSVESQIDRKSFNLHRNRFVPPHLKMKITLADEIERTISVPKGITFQAFVQKIRRIGGIQTEEISLARIAILTRYACRLNDGDRVVVKIKEGTTANEEFIDRSTLPSVILAQRPVYHRLSKLLRKNNRMAFEVLQRLPTNPRTEADLRNRTSSDWLHVFDNSHFFTFLYDLNALVGLMKQEEWVSFVSSSGAADLIL